MDRFHSRSRSCILGAILLFCVAAFATEKSVAQEVGVDGKVGHTALSTVGRDTGITYFELFPYAQMGDEQILFGDIRGFITNDGNLGTNLTTGFRFLEPSNLFVLGVNTSLDIDQTAGETYQQVGFGLEAQTSFASLVTNVYLPIGDEEQILERTLGNVRTQGNQVVIDTQDLIGVAMKGFDTSLGFNLPGDFAESREMEAALGWYHFEGTNVATIDGFKVQIDAQLSAAVSAHTAVTKDDTFGTNVTVGFDWRFGSNGLPETQLGKRLRRLVRRNYNVVLSKKSVAGTAVPLVNPTTGVAYNVQHVDNVVNIATPSGTLASPRNSIADAQAAGADLIILKSGATFTENVVLADGQMLISDSTDFQLEDANFGTIDLPATNGNNNIPAVPPMLTTINGTGIQLGNNSQIAGLTIESPAGIGILADSVTGFSVENVTINNATGNGIEIRNSSEGSFKNITIDRGSQDGILISQVDQDLTFEDIFVSNVDGNGINIDGVAGSTVDFKGDVTLNGNKTAGLQVMNLTSPVVATVDANGAPIDVTHVGTVLINNLKIDGAANAHGVHLEENIGLVSITDTDIKTTGGTSVFAKNAGQFAILDGSLEAKNAPAVDIENTELDFRLKSVSVDGGLLGIGLKQAKGQFLVLGDSLTNTAESGGLIQNTDVAIRIESSGTVATQLMNFSDNKTVAEVTNSELFRLTQSRITGTTQQFITASNLRVLEVDNSTFENNTLASQAGIGYSVSEIGGYVVRVANNVVRNTPEIFFDAKANVGGEFATLNYNFLGNDIQLTENSSIASRVDWIGAVDANVNTNLVTGSGTNQVGFQFLTQQTNATSTYFIAQNQIGFTAANGTAIEFDSQGAIIADIAQNTIEFAGRDGIGIKAESSKTSRFTLMQNSIVDNAGGATGILFPTLHDGSVVALDGNLIDLSNFSIFIDRGIILSAVTGIDDPIVQLESNLNNAISGATTTLSVPANNITGRVIINGQVLQP